MALSDREQKLLEEMERNLIEEDAGFANRVRDVGSSNKDGKKLVLGVITTLVGVVLLVLAVSLQVAFFGVVAFMVMVIGLVVATSNFRLPGLGKAAKSPGGPSFFEDRWDQRFNND
jgi:hypothetical protein